MKKTTTVVSTDVGCNKIIDNEWEHIRNVLREWVWGDCDEYTITIHVAEYKFEWTVEYEDEYGEHVTKHTVLDPECVKS